MRLKLGTRMSLLAKAQSQWVAKQIEAQNPGLHIELVGIETQGDRLIDVPLAETGGKDFFVKEIDHAFRDGTIDFAVHSMKDLSLERPKELTLAAIPPRENPRDVILFGPNTTQRLKKNLPIRIGTSSPRRLENIPAFLNHALPQPHPNHPPTLQWVPIRGNVNTRLKRLLEPPESARYLDGVVLALAGLIRLWNDFDGRAILTDNLRSLKWMVLPVDWCPTAPAQGALAIECCAKDTKLQALLKKLSDSQTEQAVDLERQILADWGGGCHQKFGATVVTSSLIGPLMFIKGQHPSGHHIEEIRWQQPSPKPRQPRPWDGSQWRLSAIDQDTFDRPISCGIDKTAPTQTAVFVASARAFTSDLRTQWKHCLHDLRVWTSGVQSWFKLAKLGIWVEGCGESLGIDHLVPTLKEPVLGLPAVENWVILTHENAKLTWQFGNVVATYRVTPKLEPKAQAALKDATHVFWASGSQFDALYHWTSPNAHHACGVGKTAQHLRRQGLRNWDCFPSVKEWRAWLM